MFLTILENFEVILALTSNAAILYLFCKLLCLKVSLSFDFEILLHQNSLGQFPSIVIVSVFADNWSVVQQLLHFLRQLIHHVAVPQILNFFQMLHE